MERRTNTLNSDDYEEVNPATKGYGSDQSFDPDEDKSNNDDKQIVSSSSGTTHNDNDDGVVSLPIGGVLVEQDNNKPKRNRKKASSNKKNLQAASTLSNNVATDDDDIQYVEVHEDNNEEQTRKQTELKKKKKKKKPVSSSVGNSQINVASNTASSSNEQPALENNQKKKKKNRILFVKVDSQATGTEQSTTTEPSEGNTSTNIQKQPAQQGKESTKKPKPQPTGKKIKKVVDNQQLEQAPTSSGPKRYSQQDYSGSGSQSPVFYNYNPYRNNTNNGGKKSFGKPTSATNGTERISNFKLNANAKEFVPPTFTPIIIEAPKEAPKQENQT